ncbi:bacterio-opsin activator [Salinigranum rubrum]|uniref:Bacterio-opsin activator n=1 Tax=Salinigranum rubrum TaxID=755307 RepID=A0A2I8VJL8_9EURY|nr:helix-turn-helix domain-containing protein [Salinigranum rubrum]AUV82137.1 bacterio-opsin activator [Salinigranum rubrum]
MRYVTLRLSPSRGEGFHPLGRRLSEEPSIRREAIHHVELLDDGTVLLLAEGSGDRDRYEEIMSSSPSVIDYMASGTDRWMAVSHLDTSEAVRQVMEWQRDAEVVIETPMLFQSDGSQRMTLLGDQRAFKRLFERATALESFSFEVVESGEYEPSAERFMRSLTARQQEILTTAVDLGYYRAPRQATHEDIAAAVDLAPSTVGDHLRKIEERVFESMTPS